MEKSSRFQENGTIQPPCDVFEAEWNTMLQKSNIPATDLNEIRPSILQKARAARDDAHAGRSENRGRQPSVNDIMKQLIAEEYPKYQLRRKLGLPIETSAFNPRLLLEQMKDGVSHAIKTVLQPPRTA